jgi:hypothetical protein
MRSTKIIFNTKNVAVNLIGTDQKLIPSLLFALENNKITLFNLHPSLEKIDLFSAEAIVYSIDGNKARIPIF